MVEHGTRTRKLPGQILLNASFQINIARRTAARVSDNGRKVKRWRAQSETMLLLRAVTLGRCSYLFRFID